MGQILQNLELLIRFSLACRGSLMSLIYTLNARGRRKRGTPLLTSRSVESLSLVMLLSTLFMKRWALRCRPMVLSGFSQTMTPNCTNKKLLRRGVSMASKFGLVQEKQVGTGRKVGSQWTFQNSCLLTRPFTTSGKTTRMVACIQGGTRDPTIGKRQEDFSTMSSTPGKRFPKRYSTTQLIPSENCTRSA